jgi:phytoene synthase
MTGVAASYDYCREIARTKAKNFYYSFLLLPAEKRDAMCAVYAFMRYSDDLSDDESAASNEDRLLALDRWRAALAEALAGRAPAGPVWLALTDTIRKYKIPEQYFYDMIDGVSSDLKPGRFATFSDLYQYCYRVASVVGLTIVHIFGFDGPRALDLAEKCGIAFQLTNILRDVREDAERGRVYLPVEDLDRFGVSELKPSDPRFRSLMEFEAQRARQYYRDSLPLVGLVHRSSRTSLWALIEIYRRLLERIVASNFAVWERRIRLSTAEKIGILVEAKVRSITGGLPV